MLACYVADQMSKPGQSPVFGNPADYGLDYEDVTFPASDGVTLSGWLIKGGTDKVVVQTHFGLQCSRSGYTPRNKGLIKLWAGDIAFLRQARYLVNAGYSVLMFDMRNHGNSGAGTVPWITWGLEERKDVIAAVDYVSGRAEYAAATIGLLSLCIGQAATALAFAAEDGLRGRERVRAMISVQPMTYEAFVRAMGMPAFVMRRAGRIIEERSGLDIVANSFEPAVGAIDVPTLVVQNRNDPWTDLDLVQRTYDALTPDKELLWLDLAKKRAAAYEWLGHDEDAIVGWYDQHM